MVVFLFYVHIKEKTFTYYCFAPMESNVRTPTNFDAMFDLVLRHPLVLPFKTEYWAWERGDLKLDHTLFKIYHIDIRVVVKKQIYPTTSNYTFL